MATSNKVIPFTDIEALEAVKTKGREVLTFKARQDKKNPGKPKQYMGTVFLEAKFNIPNANNPGYGLFIITKEMRIARSCADPDNKEDQRNQFEGTRNNIEIKLSEAGPFGQFLHLLNGPWMEYIEDIRQKKIKDMPIIPPRLETHPLLRYTLSQTNPNNPGGLLDDPLLNLQVHSGNFPPKHPLPFLAGQPQTTFYNYNESYTQVINGVEKMFYKIATVKVNDAEVPITVENKHLFITYGCSLMPGSIIYIPSAAISAKCVSLPCHLIKAIIKPSLTYSELADHNDVLLAANTQVINTNANMQVANANTQVANANTQVVNANTQVANANILNDDNFNKALADAIGSIDNL